MDLQIGKPGVDLIRRINAKCKGNALAPVQLLQPLVDIVRIPDFNIFGERRVCQYVDYTFFSHCFFPLLFMSRALSVFASKRDRLGFLGICTFFLLILNTYGTA